MSGKILVVANWKANKTVEEAGDWIYQFIVQSSSFVNQVEVAIAAPVTLLYFLKNKLSTSLSPFALRSAEGLTATLAAQDVSPYPIGQYTGAIAAKMLSDLGVTYCLLGHSERRRYFGETNKDVEVKLKQCLENNISPIVCAQSLEEIPENIRNYPVDKLYIMYEPESAISTNGVYHAESAPSVRKVITDWQNKLPKGIRFLYGGSVNPGNIRDFSGLLVPSADCLVPIISGFVVGHASLDPEEFLRIIKGLSCR